MRLLVTGGSGFIGSHTVETLISRGHDVSILSRNLSFPIDSHLLASDYHFIKGDFRDIDTLKVALSNIDCVIHLAWSGVPHSTISIPVSDVQDNVVGTLRLLEQCIHYKVGKLVFISSGGTVYGRAESLPIKEHHSIRPISSYGISKATVERFIHMYHNSYGIDYAILRVANAYGNRQNFATGQGVIGAWLSKLASGKTIEIHGNGSVVRDYIYVSDVATAISLCVENTATRHEILNVGSGYGTSLKDLVNLIGHVLRLDTEPTLLPPRIFDIPENILDTTKMQKNYNWTPSITLKNGISMMWQWIKDNPN